MISSETAYFEILEKPEISQIKCVILDYDGTLTTLRRGWNVILSEYARRVINPNNLECAALEERIAHLTMHAGGTTPRQLMGRLLAIMADLNLVPDDEIQSLEYYAKDYADYFQKKIDDRLLHFNNESETYVIQGARAMLDFIQQQGIVSCVVTGSCEIAVRKELHILKMADTFARVYGASLQMEGNLKLKAIKEIMKHYDLTTDQVLVIGDGSTEISAATKLKLPAIGIASEEYHGGLCASKRDMLVDLGAHAIIADYSGFQQVWDWLHAKNF